MSRLVVILCHFLALSSIQADVFVSKKQIGWDNDYPYYSLTIDTDQKVNLRKSIVLQEQRINLDFESTIDAKLLLQPDMRSLVDTMAMNGENCHSTTFATLSKRGTPGSLGDGNLYWLKNNFEVLPTSDDLHWGDVVGLAARSQLTDYRLLVIHTATYLGTDKETGERMILTKNGYRPSAYQIMALSDVKKLYRATKIYFYRVQSSFYNH
ncbi:MAG: hypothetical protein AB7F59_15430 [Bdellovibrionales bacterium]